MKATQQLHDLGQSLWLNQTDRFTLVMDVIDRVPGLAARAAHLKEQMKDEHILNLAYAHEHGTDRDEITNWVWPM